MINNVDVNNYLSRICICTVYAGECKYNVRSWVVILMKLVK